VCDDGNPCTNDTCNAQSGCVNVNKADGTSCADSTVCNGAETCQAGACTAGTPLVCNDNNLCTTDSCNAQTGCRTNPVTNGTPCADSTVCNGAETCQAGTCTAGAPLNCNDTNSCTTDTCNAASGCANAVRADGSTCDDGLSCTTSDQCAYGTCVGLDSCPGGTTCNPTTRSCTVPAGIAVDARSTTSVCVRNEEEVSLPVTIHNNQSNLLVVVVGCVGDWDECDLSSPQTARFGSRQLRAAGRASSDASNSVTESGIWYLTAADISSTCSSFPCTRNLQFELDDSPESLVVGAQLLFNARQAAPETFTADGGDPCGTGLLTATTIQTNGALALDIGTVASSAAFGKPGQGQVKRLENLACGTAGVQVTTKAGAPVGSTAMDLTHPSPHYCSHSVAVFAPR
jgi:hypothetical protein